MFTFNEDMSIYVTRGDSATFDIAPRASAGEGYVFKAGDVVRIKVTEKKACDNVVLQKDFVIESDCESVQITLTSTDTKIGDTISKPVDYWYEIELNPITDPQTVIGYDEDGAKVFRLFPEGEDASSYDPSPDDFPVVDKELNAGSERPVQNAAIARAVTELNDRIDNEGAARREAVGELRGLIITGDNTVQQMETIAKREAEGIVNGALEGYSINTHNHDDRYVKKDEVNYPDVGVLVPVSAWVFQENDGVYRADIDKGGIYADKEYIADVELNGDADAIKEILNAWSHVIRIGIFTAAVSVYALEKPSVALKIRLKEIPR